MIFFVKYAPACIHDEQMLKHAQEFLIIFSHLLVFVREEDRKSPVGCDSDLFINLKIMISVICEAIFCKNTISAEFLEISGL